LQIAAVLIICIHSEGRVLPVRRLCSPTSILVQNMYIQLVQKYDIHKQHEVYVYPELDTISTDKNFRGTGLATEMCRKAVAQLKADGYKLVNCTFTNPISRKIGEKLGFKEGCRIYFNDLQYEDGTLVFGQAGNEHFVTETVLD